jgi:hypothetical protein
MNAAFPVFRPAAAPGTAIVTTAVPGATQGAAGDLVRLFGLDRLPARRRLICHWHRDIDGRLTAVWEPDLSGTPRPGLSAS